MKTILLLVTFGNMLMALDYQFAIGNLENAAANLEKPKPNKKGKYKGGEDSVAVSPTFLAVADGISGVETTSKYLSNLLVNQCALEVIVNQFDSSKKKQEPSKLIEDCLQKQKDLYSQHVKQVFKKVYEVYEQVPYEVNDLTASTTFVSMLLLEDPNPQATSASIDPQEKREPNLTIQLTQVGDSLARIYGLQKSGDRFYFARVFGSKEQQSFFNCPYQISSVFFNPEQIEKLKIRFPDNQHKNELDHLAEIKPEVASTYIKVKPGDVVIIGSDGLFDNLSDADIEVALNLLLNKGFSGNLKDLVIDTRRHLYKLRFKMDNSAEDILEYFMRKQNLDPQKRQNIKKGYDFTTTDQNSKSVLFNERSSLLEFRDEYSKYVLRDHLNLSPKEEKKVYSNFNLFLHNTLSTNQNSVSLFYEGFNSNYISNFFALLAKKFSENKKTLSPFSLKMMDSEFIEHNALGSKPDDIALIATTIVKKPITVPEVVEVVYSLHREFVQIVYDLTQNVIDFVAEEKSRAFSLLPNEHFSYHLRNDVNLNLIQLGSIGLEMSFTKTVSRAYLNLTEEETMKNLYGELGSRSPSAYARQTLKRMNSRYQPKRTEFNNVRKEENFNPNVESAQTYFSKSKTVALPKITSSKTPQKELEDDVDEMEYYGLKMSKINPASVHAMDNKMNPGNVRNFKISKSEKQEKKEPHNDNYDTGYYEPENPEKDNGNYDTGYYETEKVDLRSQSRVSPTFKDNKTPSDRNEGSNYDEEYQLKKEYKSPFDLKNDLNRRDSSNSILRSKDSKTKKLTYYNHQGEKLQADSESESQNFSSLDSLRKTRRFDALRETSADQENPNTNAGVSDEGRTRRHAGNSVGLMFHLKESQSPLLDQFVKKGMGQQLIGRDEDGELIFQPTERSRRKIPEIKSARISGSVQTSTSKITI